MEEMAGPMNPSTNDECGLLVNGFDSSPCFMMPYNPSYYPTLLEDYGLRKSMDCWLMWWRSRHAGSVVWKLWRSASAERSRLSLYGLSI